MAWIDVAGPVLGLAGGDPGPNTAIDCQAHAGVPFHGYGELPDGTGNGPLRVPVDGCVVGAASADYLTQLRHLVASLTLT